MKRWLALLLATCFAPPTFAAERFSRDPAVADVARAEGDHGRHRFGAPQERRRPVQGLAGQSRPRRSSAEGGRIRALPIVAPEATQRVRDPPRWSKLELAVRVGLPLSVGAEGRRPSPPCSPTSRPVANRSGLSPDEALVYRFTRELRRDTTVSDATFAATESTLRQARRDRSRRRSGLLRHGLHDAERRAG